MSNCECTLYQCKNLEGDVRKILSKETGIQTMWVGIIQNCGIYRMRVTGLLYPEIIEDGHIILHEGNGGFHRNGIQFSKG